MTIALKDAFVERCDTHCIGWAQATASLWGMASDHCLDEPVRLSDHRPVRVRLDERHVIADRAITLKALRAATHIALRIYFKDGSFHEIDLIGVPHLNYGETAFINYQRLRR